jgi:hypothetical protein
LALNNEAIGDGTLANSGQCRASTSRKMRKYIIVISGPFIDIEMDRESVKHGDMDPRNQPALSPEKVVCVNTQDPFKPR